MAITAGNIEAKMTLDVSQFTQGVAQAQTSLDTIAQGGERVNNAFSQVEARLGQSASQIAAGMDAAGQSTAGLMQAVGKADAAAARVGELGVKAQAAAQGLSSAQAAAQASADALALLQQSAQASAANLAEARAQLDQLQASGGAGVAEAAAQVQEFEQEVQMLDQELAAATATHEANTAAVERARLSYQKLSAQLLQAEASASKADASLAAMTDTLSAAGSASQMMSAVSQLGTSTLTSAARSLGTMAASMAGFQTGTVSGTLAARGFSTVLRTLVRSASGAQLALLGVGAAAVAAGVKLYQAYQDAHDGVKAWEDVYAGIDEDRTEEFKTTVNADLELNTTGLAGKVESVYKQIGDALTDGKPDTAAVVSEIQEASQGMFRDVRERIQAWYDSEMANLDLSTTAGVQRAQELTGEYNTLMDRVNELDASTGAWITTYAGQSTEACKEALTQLESYEDELERLAGRADELTALLQSNQKAAYTAAISGVTADETTAANAVQYVNVNYAMRTDYAEQDYQAEMAKLWQEYQEKLQNGANEEELEIEYEPKFKAAADAYAAQQASLESEYKTMLANVLQGVAEAAGRSDPGLADAIQRAVAGDFSKLGELDFDNPALAATMKGIVESGVLEGVTDADLTTAEGQMRAMIELLARGTQQAADDAFSGLTMRETGGLAGFLANTPLGGVELEDSAARISQFAAEISTAWQQLSETGDTSQLKSKLDEVRTAFDLTSSSGRSGAAGIADYVTGVTELVSAASAAGNLDADSLARYNAGMSDLLSILDSMTLAGDADSLSILGDISAALNEAGYATEATDVAAKLREIWQAWQEQPAEASQPVQLTPEVEADPSYMPSPEELEAIYGPLPAAEVEQPVQPVPEVKADPSYMPSPEELEAIYGPLPTAEVEQPVDVAPTVESVGELPYWDFGYTPDPVDVDAPVNVTPAVQSVDTGGLTAALAAAGFEAQNAYAVAIEDGSGSASAAAQGMASEAGSGADSAASAFSSAGSNAGSAFAAGIRSQIGSAVSAAASMAAQAAAAARAKLSIRSPSKVFREMGANTTRGFALGISDEITRATSAVNRLATETMRAAAPVTNNDHRSVTINLNGANIAPGTDVRKFSRQLAQYIQGANFGVT